MCHIRLAIHETEKVPAARGFYDNIENSLNVVIKTRGRFYSYVQGANYSIDLDRRGKVLGIELSVPREEWVRKRDLVAPAKHEPRSVSVLEHRLEAEMIRVETNPAGNLCCMRFADERVSFAYEVARGLVFEVNAIEELSAIWVLDLVEDYGFKEEMEFRRGKKRA